jgi:hypothetical protein
MTYPRGNLEGFYHRERTPVRIMGRFTLDATPVVVDIHGRGFTVTYAAVTPGVYTIVFDDAVSDLITANATVMVALGNTDMEMQLGTFTPGGTGAATLVLRSIVAAVETDVAADDYVMFEAVVYSECLDA